jgi:hypothetical protein
MAIRPPAWTVIRITKCWTEAPDGPFRNGSRVGGGSVNMGVRQPAMILRIFRVEIDPSTRSAFEAGFRSLSVDAVRSLSP